MIKDVDSKCDDYSISAKNSYVILYLFCELTKDNQF